MPLSTNYKNTAILLGEVGGPGYLDGIPTKDEPVGALLEVFTDITLPVETWVLLYSDLPATVGAVCYPLDRRAFTNPSAWFRTV